MAENTRYIQNVKDELGRTILPSIQDEQARIIAAFAHSILVYLLINDKYLPGIQAGVLEKYRALMPRIKDCLQHEPAAAELLVQLENKLEFAPDTGKIQEILQNLAGYLFDINSEASADVLREIIYSEFVKVDSVRKAYEREAKIAEPDVAQQFSLDEEKKQKLTNFLLEAFPGEKALKITDVRAVFGGFSKNTIFIGLEKTKALPRQLCMRLDSPFSVLNLATSIDEYNLISKLYEHGIPVARPIACDETGEVIGNKFALTTKVEGSNLGDALTVTSPSRDAAVSLAQNMAKLHNLSPDPFRNLVRDGDLPVKERMQKDIASCEDRWRSLHYDSVIHATAFAWLKENISFADGEQKLIHLDIGFHNALVKDGKLTAFLDWETAAIGNPAQDVGYVYPTVIQCMDWSEFLEAYGKAGGRVPSEKEVDYYILWRHTWMSLTCIGSGVAFATDKVHNIKKAFSGLHNTPRVMHLLSEKLHEILSKY